MLKKEKNSNITEKIKSLEYNSLTEFASKPTAILHTDIDHDCKFSSMFLLTVEFVYFYSRIRDFLMIKTFLLKKMELYEKSIYFRRPLVLADRVDFNKFMCITILVVCNIYLIWHNSVLLHFYSAYLFALFLYVRKGTLLVMAWKTSRLNSEYILYHDYVLNKKFQIFAIYLEFRFGLFEQEAMAWLLFACFLLIFFIRSPQHLYFQQCHQAPAAACFYSPLCTTSH